MASDRQRPAGLRERKKLVTRDRIRAAAAELFARRGYSAATMRQIARRAHVGLGTLFNYAEDKRDLVFLIFNEELNAVTDTALASARPGAPLPDQLIAVFRAHYRWLAAQPALARILLQELTFYSSGKQAATFHAIRNRLIDGIAFLTEKAQARGEIRKSESPAVIARYIFFVYSASLRWWIAAQHPDPARGVTDLRRMLKLLFAGLRR
ncbi:MAG TPA: TetR/AcrR family transcriptional regulator [Burkholderiales bacterium]